MAAPSNFRDPARAPRPASRRRGSARRATCAAPARLALVFLLAAGCDAGDVRRAAVTGTVTLDGVPLENGHVVFVPVEGSTGPVAGSAIVDGRYDVPAEKGAVLGRARVEIRGTRRTGRRIPFGPGTTDEVVEAVPPAYHRDSTLVRDIVSGVNHLDFDLESAAEATP